MTLFRHWRAPPLSRSVARLVKENLPADVPRILQACRRRWLAGVLLENLAGSALIVAAALVVLAGIKRWLLAIAPVDEVTLAGAAMATIVLALVGALVNWPSIERIAALIDQRGQTRDRLVSALAFAREPHPGLMQQLAEGECAAFAARTNFTSLIPVRPPRLAQWLIVPLVALGLLQWDYQSADAARRADAAAAQAQLAGAVAQFEQLAQRAAKADEENPGPELRQLAEELKASAERLRAETSVAAAAKAALREISALEQVIKELQRQPSMTDELKAVAQALQGAPGMKEVLEALNRDHLAAAAKALDEALDEHSHESSDGNKQQVRDALAKAMERLAQQRQLSAALQKLAEQMRAETGNLTSAAMQKLREMIQQQQQRNESGANPASGGQQMTLQQLIAALENMKMDGGQSIPGPHASPSGGPQVSVEAFGPAASGDPRSAEARQPATGRGSERDFGTTASPFGTKSEPADKGAELALKGTLADGESLSMMMPTAGDTSKSTRRYRELYEALAPAAEDAVQQENIPLGSRFLIKRYFESIRPAE